MRRLIIMLVFLSSNSWSDQCLSFLSTLAEDPIRTATELSDVIFVGEVLTVSKKTFHEKGAEESILNIRSELQVLDRLKGDLPARVFLDATKPCDCRYDFEPGVPYLIAATVVKDSYVPKFCSLIKPANELWVELVREAIDEE